VFSLYNLQMMCSVNIIVGNFKQDVSTVNYFSSMMYCVKLDQDEEHGVVCSTLSYLHSIITGDTTLHQATQ